MADTEKKSTSSHEEHRADTEKGDHIDLNKNVSARFLYIAGVVVLCLCLTFFFPRRIANPLAGIPKAQLLSDVENFVVANGMADISGLLKKGALVAQDPASFETIKELDEDERTALRREVTHKWSQPRVLYLTIGLCSIGAAVQCVRYAFFSFGSHR
jgi:hypothetical protein